MALQWMILGFLAAVEAVLVLLVTLPVPKPLRAQVLKLIKPVLQPGLAVVPFALFQLLDVYWKFEHRPNCAGRVCTSADRDHFDKSTFKGQRNVLLGIGAALLYWLLYRLVQVQGEIVRLEGEVKRLKTK